MPADSLLSARVPTQLHGRLSSQQKSIALQLVAQSRDNTSHFLNVLQFAEVLPWSFFPSVGGVGDPALFSLTLTCQPTNHRPLVSPTSPTSSN